MIPGFLAGFREVDVLGTCDRIENPNAPVWSKVHRQGAQVGTLAWRESTGTVAPHIHLAAGLTGLGSTVQLLAGNMLLHGQMTPDVGLRGVSLPAAGRLAFFVRDDPDDHGFADAAHLDSFRVLYLSADGLPAAAPAGTRTYAERELTGRPTLTARRRRWPSHSPVSLPCS